MESVVAVSLLWLAIVDVIAAAPPPPPALPTLPIVMGRGTTPAAVGTIGASPNTADPAFETVTAAVAAAGDERGRLQMLLVAAEPVPVVGVVFDELDVYVQFVVAVVVKLFVILRMSAVPVCVVLVDDFVVIIDSGDAQWSGNSHGPSLK